MKIRETVIQVMAENEKSFQDIPESRASKLVQLTLQQIARQVEETAEGRVTIQGLGVFIIKNVEREKDGVKSKARRVSFRAKSAAAGGDEDKAEKPAKGGRKAGAKAEAEGSDDAPAGKTAGQAARKAAKQAARKADRQAARKGGGRKSGDE